jgi:hypothetical protein
MDPPAVMLAVAVTGLDLVVPTTVMELVVVGVRAHKSPTLGLILRFLGAVVASSAHIIQQVTRLRIHREHTC